MTTRDRKALGGYIRDIADKMELRDWTIDVEHEPCEGYNAVAHCTYGQRRVSIAFAADFRDYPPAEQRETVVHELIHAHHAVCWHMVQNDLGDALGKPVYYVFCDSYRRAMEYQVDALAKVIARHMPLIEWREPKHGRPS